MPLDEGILCQNGRFRFIDGDTGQERSEERFIRPLYGEGKHRDWVIPLAQRLVNEGKQVIVFRETTGGHATERNVSRKRWDFPP